MSLGDASELAWVSLCPPGKTREEGLGGDLMTTQSQFLPFRSPSSPPPRLFPPDLESRSQTNRSLLGFLGPKSAGEKEP